MVKQFSGIFSLVAVAMAFMVTAPTQAAVELRFTPADTTIAPGTPGRLAIHVDQVVDLRTIEITVSYDTTIINSLSGEPGALFSESGFFLWSDFEEDEPGTWHGYTVVMGAEDCITGPGELYFWDINGKTEGISPVTVEEVRLFDPDGIVMPDVTLPSTTVNVGQVTPAFSLPEMFPGTMTAYPNPFNPRTSIEFELPQAATIFLAVYDARGRLVTVLMDRHAEAGVVAAVWDGKNSAGLEQPGGVYFFLMESPLGKAITKAVLLK